MTFSATLRHALRAIGSAATLALVAYSATVQAHGNGHDHAHEHTEDQAQHAHVHGMVQLDIAIDGADLVVQLTAPKADIIGFEHAAATEEEKRSVVQAITKLTSPDLFMLNASAACKLVETDIDGLGEHSHENDTQAKDHKHPAHKASNEKIAEHNHSHHDVTVSYQWQCANAEQLASIEVQLSKQFSSIHTINVQMALPQGQFSRTLKSGQSRLSWK